MKYAAYQLLQPILNFKIGSLVPTDGQFGYLGQGDWGWTIPLFIIEAHPEWFEKVTK